MTSTLVFSLGDPAGIGPEVLLRCLADLHPSWRALIVGERAALEAHAEACGLRLPEWVELGKTPSAAAIADLAGGQVGLVEIAGIDRQVVPGEPSAGSAAAALRALDKASDLVAAGHGDALITLPVSKEQIATHVDPSFRGHTDHLARRAGLQVYGRDYLMAFLAGDLRVALLSTHQPLLRAIESIDQQSVVDALICLHRHVGGRIALAGLNPHAGEGGLLGSQDREILEPAVEQARAQGVDVRGPLSADSLFARAREGAFDWVLALYHDQGLIAVKTAAFGEATNWTLGLPYLRTSVDHGTAFDIAGQGVADPGSLAAVIATTLDLIRLRH